MDGSRLSLFPHHAWLSFHVGRPADGTPLVFPWQSVAHGISFVVAGDHRLRWVEAGRDRLVVKSAGTAHFLPADDRDREFVIEAEENYDYLSLVLPRHHFSDCVAADGVTAPDELRPLIAPDDRILKACLTRLAGAADDEAQANGLRRDEAARRLLLRLLELQGRRPVRHADESVFDRGTLGRTVELIDARLRDLPSLAEFGYRTGLSPSHFARKFRRSTGTSVQRFVNRRRLQASLRLLPDRSLPIATIALDLGFASQSHFTRLFGRLTGMTTARFRECVNPRSSWG